mmetsp:Transcript_25538/g.64013  ORF Transcript_25538/g.64013 Transcript_25538/m.64013 type:complete len:113 (-) Transcript_25538:1585-1923(-)
MRSLPPIISIVQRKQTIKKKSKKTHGTIFRSPNCLQLYKLWESRARGERLLSRWTTKMWINVTSIGTNTKYHIERRTRIVEEICPNFFLFEPINELSFHTHEKEPLSPPPGT